MSDPVIDQARRLLRLADVAPTYREPSIDEDISRIKEALAREGLEISPARKEES
jgi:hypothetical protein